MSERTNFHVAAIATAALNVSAFGATIYVDANASGPTHDGSHWCSAFLELSDALAASAPGDVIVVAEGVYRPDQGNGQTPGDREASFALPVGVALYGGFAGCGSPVPNQRDVDLYETILSGDLAGNDGPNFANNEENAYHVLTAGPFTLAAVLDGFTVVGGNANGDALPLDAGGGMRIDAGSPTLHDCVFTGNSATFGGGLENFNGSHPTIEACLFVGNRATFRGGGMHNNASSPTITDTVFLENLATNSGGGMRNWNLSEPQLSRCAFEGNHAGFGGGMVNDESSPVLQSCIFRANTSDDTSGGLHNWISHPLLINCVLVDNEASTFGGGIYSLNASAPTLINCTLGGNYAGVDGGGLFTTHDSDTSLANCVVWGNLGGSVRGTGAFTLTFSDIEGAMMGSGNMNVDPLFADTAAGDLRLAIGSPCIDAGRNEALPSDVLTDLDGRPRFFDQAHMPDTGKGEPPIVDLGAYEFGAGACVDEGLFSVVLCHQSPGANSRSRTISVTPADALDHFAHGDTCGACPGLRKSR